MPPSADSIFRAHARLVYVRGRQRRLRGFHHFVGRSGACPLRLLGAVVGYSVLERVQDPLTDLAGHVTRKGQRSPSLSWCFDRVWDVFSNPLTNSVNGFLHSATAALTFQFTVPTGWYRRGAISAPFSMGAAGISGAPLLSPGCYCTRHSPASIWA
jgi:hypothetical protein